MIPRERFDAGRERGFALLIAVIFMAVMLMFGVALSSIAYKQQLISSSGVESQYAFYAADGGLECALYEDQQQGLFVYDATPGASVPSYTCGGMAAYSLPASRQITTIGGKSYQILQPYRFELDYGGVNRCVDVTIYKPQGVGATYVFSQGYDVSCAIVASGTGTRYVSRGLDASY